MQNTITRLWTQLHKQLSYYLIEFYTKYFSLFKHVKCKQHDAAERYEHTII